MCLCACPCSGRYGDMLFGMTVVPSRSAQVATFMTCVWGVPASNLGCCTRLF
jgi:hypothetical protein